MQVALINHSLKPLPIPALTRPGSLAASSARLLRQRCRNSTAVRTFAIAERQPTYTSHDYTVADIMTTTKLFTCTKDTTTDEALEILVDNHITGLPVVDRAGTVIGVVSDFDLLALEGIGQEKSYELFPDTASDWNSFFEVQKLLGKMSGRFVGDVMTSQPICVRPATSMFDAANMLLKMKIRRLPVVDEQGKLVGMLTRGNVIKAALVARKSLKKNDKN